MSLPPLDPEERRSLIEEIKSLEHRLEEEAVQRRMDQVLSASRAADARLSDEVLQDSVVHTTPHIELDSHPFKGMKDEDVGMAVAELFLKTSDRPEPIAGEPSYDDPRARAQFEEVVALAGQVTADERKLIQEIQVLEQALEEAKSSGDKEETSLLEKEIVRQQAALRELRSKITDIQI